MVTALGYIRVSTDAQGERGYGLDSQRAAIAEECDRRGWHLERVYVDVASGKSTRRRPEYAAAIEHLASGRASVLVVAKLDRLSRSLLDFAGLMAQAQREGWSISALDIGVDTSTINGELIANIIMALAQWERRIIGDRTRAALVEARERGKSLGRPSGVSEDTQTLIRLLRDSGKGYHAIATMLNAESIPTGQGGRQWYAATVRKLSMSQD